MEPDNQIYYKALGKNISYYRKRAGYTQKDLADQLHLDRSTISKLETAGAGVSLHVVFAIAEYLRIPVFRFFLFSKKR